MSKLSFRRDLSIPGLLVKARRYFQTIPDTQTREGIPLADHLMSGLAVFGLKYASLLQFDRDSRDDDVIRHNLHRLYGIKRAPSDTYLRQRLDTVDPHHLRKLYKKLFSVLQRGKGLEGFEVFGDHYLLALDGTGYFSSYDIHCEQCCEKHHRNGQVSYYHQLLGAVLVHPEYRAVFPFAPEPILKQDGERKNDCERNAAKRLLESIRREHPHLKLVVVEDGLASNGPHIKQLQALNFRFILGAKENDHRFLFDWVENTRTTQTYEYKDEKGSVHRFRYLNEVPLNDTHFNLPVNFLEYWETKPNGKEQHFSWVTDILLGDENLVEVMQAGRARWRIENETFNTLKNQGYHFEHNFGHGNQHLSTVLMHLMMLAFLMDQIQQRCCRLFQQAMAKMKTKGRFWQKFRARFSLLFIPDWETFYRSFIDGLKSPTMICDTS